MNYTDMAHQQRSILNHLRDMFSSTFDEDLIESVLMQRNWNGEYLSTSRIAQGKNAAKSIEE